MTLAVLLGMAAVGLAVLGSTQKQVQLGLICGLWAALIGLIAMFGIRRRPEAEPERPITPQIREPHRGELQLRSDSAQRREYEAQLQAMLRHEIGRAVHDELQTLRSEVAGLRSDVVEKVHGQLQLERIETTRVIGSDLEALQDEVRRLVIARDALAADRPQLSAPDRPLDTANPPVPASPAAHPVATLETTWLPRVDVATPPPEASPPPPPVATTTAPAPASEPAAPAPARASEPAAPAPARASEPATPAPATLPQPEPLSGDDPFAGLPRLGRFILDDSDAVPRANRRPDIDLPASQPRPAPGRDREQPGIGYVGRRRRSADADDADDVTSRYAVPGGRRQGDAR
jgi:hypothetical protein